MYASLLRRYQALVFDALIYLAALTAALFLPVLLGLDTTGNRITMGAFLAFLFLYDPLLVGLRAGTLGHYHHKIRVVDGKTSLPIGVPRAFARAIAKAVLGLLSLVFMLVTSRAQSVHDLLVGSIVVPATPARTTGIDVMLPAEVPVTGMPSRLRRVLVIVAYSFLTLVILDVAGLAVVSHECLEYSACDDSDRVIFDGIGFIWVILTATLLVYGWRGLLLGCRRRRTDIRVAG